MCGPLQVIKWANAECGRQGIPATPDNLKKLLEDVVPLLRFPCMDAVAIAEHVVPLCVLARLRVLVCAVRRSSPRLLSGA